MKWFKDHIKQKLTEINAWIAVVGIILLWILGDGYMSIFFLIVYFLKQKTIDAWVAKYAPALSARIDQIPED